MAEPKLNIVTFVCNWCSYAGADMAGGQRLEYAPEIKLVRVMCSGRVDPKLVLAAFYEGADGVMILGCHPGDCHYRSGNIKAMRRSVLMEKTLTQMGLEPERLRLDWVGAGESERFQRLANEMVQSIERLGPLPRPGKGIEEGAR